MPRCLVNIFNKLHFSITAGGHKFAPGKEIQIDIETTSSDFYRIRSEKGLRINKLNNERFMPEQSFGTNGIYMVYDAYSQHRGEAYVRAIDALARPMVAGLKALGFESAGFTNKPGVGVNVRFFSELRINQQGKYPVGPRDVFCSHGIGDKNYWIASRIAGYNHAMVPGPAWKERIEAGREAAGFGGEVHVVGYTKLDPVFQGEYAKQPRESGKPYVVWAPTHGYNNKYKGRSSYPQCLKLIKEIEATGLYDTCLALHPTSRMNRRRKQNVSLQELVDADVVIADAGSTLYEAWALGKPVVFPDWICKDDVLGHFKRDPENLEYQIYDKGIGYHAQDMKHLIKLIGVALRDGMKDQEIEFMESIFPSELRGRAGEAAAKVLKSLV